MRLLVVFGFILALFITASGAQADWEGLVFDLSHNDSKAYVTDVPGPAFTPQGLQFKLRGEAQYSWTSTRIFSGDFSFDLQIDIPERSGDGQLWIDMVLINDQQQRKVVGTFENRSLLPGSDKARIQYFRNGTAVAVNGISSFGNQGHKGNMEVLRMHKVDSRVWFMQRPKQHAYRFTTQEYAPVTDTCEAYQIGFVVRTSPDCTAVLNIKQVRISGTAIVPRMTDQRAFLFDFGPVSQELEDGFTPVSEYTLYHKDKGFGWVVPDMDKVVYAGDGIPSIGLDEIEPNGFRPLPGNGDGSRDSFIRQCYWLQLHDKKVFYSLSHGLNYIDFFKKALDIRTPLERDGVGMGKPCQFAFDEPYQKDIEERRGSIYMGDDLSTEFVVDLPNGHYNVIVGVGYAWSAFAGGERDGCNVEIEGRVRKTGMRAWWRRTVQNTIRDVQVNDGQMNLRFFCDVRQAMNPWANHDLATGWQVQYVVILPAEDRELLSQWEWRIIKRRGEVVRRVTFVDGKPAVTRNEGNFLSVNSKPLYFLKAMNNFWPGESDHFTYYSLANILSIKHSFSNSQHFFKPNWEEMSYSDDYPWFEIDRMNTMYTWGYLASLHEDTILSFVPRAISGEGTPTADHRGRQNRWNVQPPLNSPLGKEIQKEAYTMLANQLGEHPSNLGHMIYDELWHPNDSGYDEQSMIQYWDWLAGQYKDIETLNADWGTAYKSFDEVQAPAQGQRQFWQFTPEWVHFRNFRSWAQMQMVRHASDLVHQLEPGHFGWGARGDVATQSWYPAAFVDGFGWYTPYAAVSAARYFGRAALCQGYSLNCEYASVDGRKQADHVSGGPEKSLAQDEADVYNTVVSSVFKGAKGFFSEWASDGVTHPFHRTALARGIAKDINGQVATFQSGATDGPPVKVERHALMVQAANQMLYRLGHLWLPAQPPKPKVLFPTVPASFFLDFFGERPNKDFESVALRALRSSGLAADFVNMSAVKDLSQYQLIVLAEPAVAISAADAQRLRQFVANGGKLLLLNAGGFTDDSRPRRFHDQPGEVYPLKEFADLGGYRLVAANEYHKTFGKVQVQFAACDVAPEFSDGQAAGEWETSFYYELPEGSQSTIFLKGTIIQGGRQVAMGIVSKDRNVAVINVPDAKTPEELVHPLSRWLRRLVDSWQIESIVSLAGVDDAWDLYAGCLDGAGYRLAAVCNSSPDQDRNVALQVKGMPEGQYAVIDVTGQRPEVQAKPDGGWSLSPVPAPQRASRISMVLSAQQLARQGIPTPVKPRQAQVWLIRPIQEKVWNSVWPGALGEFARRGVTIAYGQGPADKAGADRIAAVLRSMGFQAMIVSATDIKLKELLHEVRVKPEDRENKRHEDPATWPLVDAYRNEVVDTNTSLIVIGSEETNPLLRHLAKDGSYVYDKVGEKITAEYPGPGRGVIGWIDAVNAAIYDLRSEARDAIVVGGSDQAGTLAAAQSLADMFAKTPAITEVDSGPRIGRTPASTGRPSPASLPATATAPASVPSAASGSQAPQLAMPQPSSAPALSPATQR